MALNPAQLAELSALLEQALDMPALERQAWLATPPATDPVVLAALSRALQLPVKPGGMGAISTQTDTGADAPPTDSRSAAAYWLRSGRFSDMGFTGVTGHSEGVDATIVAGATMDRYRLLRAIGSGGMGTVWLAERIDADIIRPVALKLPLRLAGNRQIAERFARERGVLAKLTHPNIATLYDAGVSVAGVPFLALEYVEGQPITDYADSKGLPVAARLALFAQVLAAVQHAHERLVIHRDLKPSNILVTVDGTVKLLDFGIAKLIEEADESVGAADPSSKVGESDQAADATEQSELTQQVGIAVTPNYASPEQLAGESLTTATDVYSLGVVLYELLSGVRPYRLKRENQAALVQGVLEAEVLPPSQVTAIKSAAPLQRSSPAKLKRLLRSDLDAISLKALEKTTDKRYRTAEEFATDLQRYQQHAPVQAVPSSALYRAKKFVARNRIGVASAVALSLAILAGIGATLWQLRETERELARRTAVQSFLVGIFKTADPEIARGKVYTAKDLLSVGVARVDKQFADQPEVAAALYGEIGMIFSALGDSKTAGELFGKKIKLLEAIGRTSSVEYVDALTRHGRYLHDQGRRQEALPLLEKAVAIAPNLGVPGDAIRWEAMQKLAMVRIEVGDHAAAAKLLESSLAEMSRVPKAKRPARQVWLAEYGLAETAVAVGDFTSALQHFTAVSLWQKGDLTLERVDVLRTERNLAVAEVSLRMFKPAYARLAAIIDEQEKIFGVDAEDTLLTKTDLSKALAGLGRSAEALAMQDQVVTVRRARSNANDLNLAEARLIRLLIAVKRYKEAEAIAQRTFSFFASQPTPNIRLVENLRMLLSEIQLATGRPEAGLQTGLLTLENQLKRLGSKAPTVADIRDVVGATYRSMGQFAVAELQHEQAYQSLRDQLGIEHARALRSKIYLTLAQIGTNQSGAATEFEKASTSLGALLPAQHPAQSQIAAAKQWVALDSPARLKRLNLFHLIDL